MDAPLPHYSGPRGLVRHRRAPPSTKQRSPPPHFTPTKEARPRGPPERQIPTDVGGDGVEPVAPVFLLGSNPLNAHKNSRDYTISTPGPYKPPPYFIPNPRSEKRQPPQPGSPAHTMSRGTYPTYSPYGASNYYNAHRSSKPYRPVIRTTDRDAQPEDLRLMPPPRTILTCRRRRTSSGPKTSSRGSGSPGTSGGPKTSSRGSSKPGTSGGSSTSRHGHR